MQTLEIKSQYIKSHLRILHETYDSVLIYPVVEGLDSGIYTLEKQYIVGTFDKPVSFETFMRHDSKHLLHVSKIEPYYLGGAYLVIRKPIDYSPLETLQYNSTLFMLIAGAFFIALGIYLGRLFIAPMREYIKTMKDFIQDTTHELNTPISVILANIEMLETFGKCNTHKEFERIQIASKTLSILYDDLTYLNLNHHYYRTIQSVDLSELLRSRCLYFDAMIQDKMIDVTLLITPDSRVDMDARDAMRLMDNLISNAIKYNKPKGALMIELTHEHLIVEDGGIGIEQTKIDQIFNRFTRLSSSQGGFGIGLSIVRQIIVHYGFVLSIDSKLHKGTKVMVRWSKQ